MSEQSKSTGYQNLGVVDPKKEREQRQSKKIDLSSIPTHDPDTGKKYTAMERLQLAQKSVQIKAPEIKIEKVTEESKQQRGANRTRPQNETKKQVRPSRTLPDSMFSPVSRKSALPKIEIVKPDEQETAIWKTISNSEDSTSLSRPEGFLLDREMLASPMRSPRKSVAVFQPDDMSKSTVSMGSSSSISFNEHGEHKFNRPDDFIHPMDVQDAKKAAKRPSKLLFTRED